MIKAVILDCDGTILETLTDIQGALNKTLNKYGFEPRTYEQVRLGIGRGTKKLVEVSLPKDADPQLIDKIAQDYFEEYGRGYAISTKPYPGIQELLNKLEEKGIILTINTNKPDAFVKDLAKIHFPNNKFAEIIGASPDHPNKPDPYGCDEIVRKLGISKDEAIYVGDSESDVATAKNAKLKCIGCLWGFRDLKTLQKSGAEYIVKSPNEILDIIESL